jgi:hypothetical protein
MQRTWAKSICQTMGESCQEIVELIPLAWQYPEITRGHIVLVGHTFATSTFQETMWKQTSDIRVHGQRIGVVKVCYLVEKPTCDEVPLLWEERSLLDTIAKLLGEIIGRQQAEGERARYDAQFKALAEASLAINSARSVTEATTIVTGRARDIIGAHQAMTGFSPQTLPAFSNGIAGMCERALTLGGQLSIESAPGSGTHIMAEWPLSPTAAVSSSA